MPTNTNSATTRSTRSRYSSPQVAPAGATDPTRGQGSSRGSTPAASVEGPSQQSFMRRWLEPDQNKKPAGQLDPSLMRHSVVDHMASTGAMPKLGTFKKASVAAPPLDIKPPVRKIIVVKRSSTAETTTPTPTPAPAAAPVAPTAPVATAAVAAALPAPAPYEDETEEEDDDAFDESHYDGDSIRRRSVKSRDDADEEYTPNKKSHKSQSRRSMSRMSGGGNGSISSTSFQHVPSMAARQAQLKALTDDAVTHAVDEAIAHCRYPTAYALRTLYDDKCHEPDFVSLMARIFRQQADTEDLEDFGRLMAERKREGRRGNKGLDYFEPPSTDRRLAPHKPRPAPYRHLVKLDLRILHQNTKPERHIQPILAEQSVRAPTSEPTTASPRPSLPPAISPEPAAAAEPAPEPAPEAATEPAHEPESEPVPQSEPTRPPSPSPAPKPAPSPTPEPPALAPEPRVIAPEPRVAAPEPLPARRKSAKRELPPDEEALGEPDVDAHVRKRRRSNRAPGGTRAMAKGGKPKTATPAKRRTRARSQSSTSSLSSVQSMTPPASIPADDADEELLDAPPSRASPAVAEAEEAEQARASPPVEEASTTPPVLNVAGRKPRRSVAARKSLNGNAGSGKRGGQGSKSTSTTPAPSKQPTPAPVESEGATPAGQPFGEPEPLNEPLYPHHTNPKRTGKGANNGLPFPGKIVPIEDNDEKWQLRKSARAITNSYKAKIADDMSFARKAQVVEGPEPDERQVEATPPPTSSSRPRTSLPTVRPGTAAASARNTRSSRKRSHDDAEEQPSPTTVHFGPPDAGPGTAATSRAGTPLLRPAKKARTGLRVKNSPMKRKAGTSAGIPRASGERASPGAPARDKEDDNDDYCSSCGGSGQLICCDGCTRSFHFSCVDPPLSQDSMPVEWFCNVCRTERDLVAPDLPGPPPLRFSFRPLAEKLDARNSSAFSLPIGVRDRFESVRTGTDGEYEEIVPVTKGARKKKSDDEVPDLYRLRDNDGNPVVCHACQQSSASTRAIIPCQLCGLHWHLDCLDPPMANPPALKTWKCPCHIEDILAKVPGPAHKYRKVKAATVIEPLFSRGYVNNGYIEVELDGEDESYWRNAETYGRTVRLPERAIKLDFLSRARENRKGKPIPPLGQRAPAVTSEAPQLLSKPSLEHQQAAYNLAQLSGQGTSAIETLVDTLIAEAQPEVVSMMARVDSDHVASNDVLTNMDKQGLRAFLAQMNQMRDRVRDLLGEKTPGGASPQPMMGSSAAQDQAARVPSLTHSQTTRAESENPAIEQATPSPMLESTGSPKTKNLPSPAASEDAMAASGMDEDTTLTVKTGLSPSESASHLPATPTDAKIDCPNGAVLIKQSPGDKTPLEIDENGMDLD